MSQSHYEVRKSVLEKLCFDLYRLGLPKKICPVIHFVSPVGTFSELRIRSLSALNL